MDTVLEILIFIVVGILAGWLASMLVRGRGLGLVGDLVLGIIGALIGGLIFRGLDVEAGGLLVSFVAAVAGAVVLLVVVRVLKKA